MPRTAFKLALALTLAALAAASPVSAGGRPKPPPRSASRQLTASIDLSSPGPSVPASFLGLSFEVKALPQIAHFGDEGNLVALLRSLGTGVLRFGGVTADTQAAWSSDGSIPSWATTPIVGDDLAGIDRLAREARWGVLLTVNLGHFDPQSAAGEVSSAQTQLGSSLAGIEIGNEPDGYVIENLRSDPYTFDDYKQQLDAYLQAIGASFPLVGPSVSTPKRSSWIVGDAEQERPVMLTDHYYPLASCHGYLPVVGDLLKRGIRAGEKRVVDRLAALSNSTGLPLRLGETNNIACGGEAGVSNTFASALWAVDYITRAMSDGLAGINFHDIISNCQGYGAVCAPTKDDLEAGNLSAQPEWYALLLTRQLVGDQPLPSRLGSRGPNVTLAAFRSGPGRLHIVLVDDEPPGSRPITVRLRLPAAFKRGTILRLTGPAPDATSGVKLGGAGVRSDGSFQPQRRLPRLAGRPGSLSAVIYPSSAALVTVSRGP